MSCYSFYFALFNLPLQPVGVPIHRGISLIFAYFKYFCLAMLLGLGGVSLCLTSGLLLVGWLVGIFLGVGWVGRNPPSELAFALVWQAWFAIFWCWSSSRSCYTLTKKLSMVELVLLYHPLSLFGVSCSTVHMFHSF